MCRWLPLEDWLCKLTGGKHDLLMPLMRALMDHHRCTLAGAGIITGWLRRGAIHGHIWTRIHLHLWCIGNSHWLSNEPARRRGLNHHRCQVGSLTWHHIRSTIGELTAGHLRAWVHDILDGWLIIRQRSMTGHWGLMVGHISVLHPRRRSRVD